MRTPSYSGQFRRDVKRAEERAKDMAKLRHVLQLLIDDKPLPIRLRDHPLRGDWKGWRDLHIESDWLLIYKADTSTVRFERTGTHADLFNE
ncbi:MAG: YafQ family addiction module toxin [Rhizobiales bacterium]|nr:YafQ family addiction module toxin [Hyphomicrobiales bacterium]